ncbi:glycosyltransferase [Streptomyces sp. NPDC096198]|uniref:glycosyltransferase n=1 Tax=Streptomyces sp. NPDC096198 TaxID=3366080 RepID=UPI0038133248
MTSSPRSPGGGACAPEDPGSLSVALLAEGAGPLAAPGTGGRTPPVLQLAEALAERGHRVTVYARRTDPGLPDRTTPREGVEVHQVTAGPPEPLPRNELLPHLGEFGRRLARIWRVRPPDVVHSHCWMSGLASLRTVRELGLPLLHTCRALGTAARRHPPRTGTDPLGHLAQGTPEHLAHETEVGLGCDHALASCRDEAVELVRLGIPGDKISVVPCGVDTALFTPHGPAAPPGTGRGRLLQLGGIGPHRGTEVSLAALARLPGTELLVVGGPRPDRLDADAEVRRLRRIAADAGVADRLRFLGRVPHREVPALLRGADVVVCPGDHEPLGRAALEAMACGRPVVASAVGGHLDTVADPGTGRLVPPRDPDALARAVHELLADHVARAACGAAGRRRVLRRYGWARVAAVTETAYCVVLDAQYAAARTMPAP